MTATVSHIIPRIPDEDLPWLSVDYRCRTRLKITGDAIEDDFIQEYEAKVVHTNDRDEDLVIAQCKVHVARIDILVNLHRSQKSAWTWFDSHSQEMSDCIPLLHDLEWCPRFLRLRDLWVSPANRGRGLGSLLVERINDDLADDFSCMALDAAPIVSGNLADGDADTEDPTWQLQTREKLVRFYGRLGFTEHRGGLMWATGDLCNVKETP